MHKLIHETAIKHFIRNQPPIGVFGDKLNGGHFNMIANKTRGSIYDLIDHLKEKSEGGHLNIASFHSAFDKVNESMKPKIFHREEGGSTSSGGSAGIGGSAGFGGSLHMGGELPEPPQDQRAMYHYTLQLSPHQMEFLREIANQLLGAKPSPVWDDLVPGGEPLESEAEEYEKIIDMPNTHSAARLIESDIGHGKGGGFMKAFKHVAKIGSKIYKAGHHALGWVNRNKDLLMNIVPEDYRAGAEGLLETANKIDSAVNPIIDATIDAVKENATPEDKQKLKRLAEQSIDKAIETHLPQAKPYMDAAKDLKNTIEKTKRPINAN